MQYPESDINSMFDSGFIPVEHLMEFSIEGFLLGSPLVNAFDQFRAEERNDGHGDKVGSEYGQNDGQSKGGEKETAHTI